MIVIRDGGISVPFFFTAAAALAMTWRFGGLLRRFLWGNDPLFHETIHFQEIFAKKLLTW